MLICVFCRCFGFHHGVEGGGEGFSGLSCTTYRLCGGGRLSHHAVMGFCRVCGFHHGVGSRFGLQEGVGFPGGCGGQPIRFDGGRGGFEPKRSRHTVLIRFRRGLWRPSFWSRLSTAYRPDQKTTGTIWAPGLGGGLGMGNAQTL